MIKRNNGITLIALVVTIIVLLILAGVSIAMLTGENGILTQARNAKNRTEEAKTEEISNLDSMESLINEYTGDVNIPQVVDENPGQLEQENETTFVINSIEDLVVFSYNVRTGNKYEGQTVKLGLNLDFKSDKSYVDPDRTDYGIYGYEGNLKQLLTTGEGFIPIGSQDGTNSFYGTLDGNNNVICSLYENINNTNENESIKGGLFAENYGEIRNIDLKDVNLEFKAERSLATAGISGINYNNIINCNVSGNMRTTAKVYSIIGGICGEARGETNIQNCSSFINIYSNHINNVGSLSCGGIVAQTNVAVDKKVNIDGCFNKGNINIDGGNTQISVGGIIGNSSSEGNCNIKNCYNSGKIQGITSRPYESGVAGIAGGLRYGNLSNCYNIGDIIGSESENETGDVFTIGGILGDQFNDTTVNNVFNLGKVICSTYNNDFEIGGLIGGVGYGSIISIANGYNTGKIETEGVNSNKIGSISGSGEIIPNNCYYLKGTFDIGVAGNETFTGVTELQNISDFPSVLEVVNGDEAFKEDVNNINNGYPILSWQ